MFRCKFIFLAILGVMFLSCNSGNKNKKYSDVKHELLGRIIDSAQPITMDQFIGANGFVDDPVEMLEAIGFLREYHNWAWDEGNFAPDYPGFPYNQMQFAPSGPGWSYDDFYAQLKNDGIGISPCIQGSVPWLQGKTAFPEDDKPVDNPGLDATNPRSYHKKANFMYQFAARYGHTKIADSSLTLASNQKPLSGLGLINYVEDWNEQDKGWKGKSAEFTPEEYAAMASADYDGHCNTLNLFGRKYGVKNADPTIKLVMGGLATLSVDYVKRMKTWFENNRCDKKFATDVLNFHIYTFKEGTNYGGKGPALSPEQGLLREKLMEVVKYRNEQLPGKEVWVSEFGWDTNPESPLSAPEIGDMDRQEVQGIWLIRAYMAFIAAGVDRAQMYMSRDVDPKDKTWFASCGLMGPKGDFTPKKSWYYVSTMKNALKNTRYIGWQESADPNILIYKFKDISSKKGVYVLWAKTSKAYQKKELPVTLSANATNATLTTLVPGSTKGEESILSINKGTVFADVSERPVFITVDAIL